MYTFAIENSSAADALRQFREALNDGGFYPNINKVMNLAGPVLLLFSFVLGVIAVAMICAFVFRYSIDCIFILVRSSGKEPSGFLAERASAAAQDKEDLWSYVKENLWQSILALAIAGLLITGQALPLSGMLIELLGSGINALTNFENTYNPLDDTTGAGTSGSSTTSTDIYNR